MKVLQPYLEQLNPHVEGLKQGYQNLGKREQTLLKVLSIFLPCFLFVFLYWQPMQIQVTQLQQYEIQLEKDLAEAKLLAQRIQKSSGQSKAPTGNFMAQVERLAQKTAVRAQIVHLKPQTAMDGSTRMRIRFQQVRYKGLLNFLYALAQAGFSLEQASLNRVEKQAYVNVDVWVMQP